MISEELKKSILNFIEAEQETRNKTIQIRVSPSEYALLTILANEWHLSIGTYMRSTVLYKAQEAVKETQE